MCVLILCLALTVLSTPLAFAADTILLHGHIYTGNSKAPWAEALAVSGTRIEAIGSDQEIARLQRPKDHGHRSPRPHHYSRHFRRAHPYVVWRNRTSRNQSVDARSQHYARQSRSAGGKNQGIRGGPSERENPVRVAPTSALRSRPRPRTNCWTAPSGTAR